MAAGVNSAAETVRKNDTKPPAEKRVMFPRPCCSIPQQMTAKEQNSARGIPAAGFNAAAETVRKNDTKPPAEKRSSSHVPVQSRSR